MVEESLEVKFPTIWTDGKAEVGKSQRGDEKKKQDQRREREWEKEDAFPEKVGQSRNTESLSNDLWLWKIKKVGSLKRRVQSHVVRCEIKTCTPLRLKAHLQVKAYKTHHARTIFGS